MHTIILADCTPSVCSAVQAAFPKADFKILAFSDGTEVIKALQRVTPDVFLLNLYLESKEGYEVCHFLNSQERYSNIPIFLLKGAFEPDDEERLRNLEYREIIVEPFDAQSLFRKVQEVLEGKDDPQTLPEEPVPADDVMSGRGFEERVKSLVREEILRNEERLVERLKGRILDDLRKDLHQDARTSTEGEASEEEFQD
jgi:DNA-binding response OmpR family regulator